MGFSYAPTTNDDNSTSPLPKANRGKAQSERSDEPIKSSDSLKGNISVGQINHIALIHGIFDSYPISTGEDIMDVQERILKDLQNRNPKPTALAVESFTDFISHDNPGRYDALRGRLMDKIFGGALIDQAFDGKLPTGPLNDLQRRCLYRFGVANVYARCNPDVDIIPTTTPEQGTDGDNATREKLAIEKICDKKEDYLKRYPSIELFYGGGHSFGIEDFPASTKPEDAPLIKRFEYAGIIAERIEKLKEAKTPLEQQNALRKINGINLDTWKTLTPELQVLSFEKVASPDTSWSSEKLRDVLLSSLGQDRSAELTSKIQTCFEKHTGPFADLFPRVEGPCGKRAGDKGVSWKDVGTISDMGKLTILATTEWHGPTQEKILELALPNTFSAFQLRSLLTPRAQSLAIDKMLVNITQWPDDPKEKKDALTGKQKLFNELTNNARDQSVKDKIAALFAGSKHPFSKEDFPGSDKN